MQNNRHHRALTVFLALVFSAFWLGQAQTLTAAKRSFLFTYEAHIPAVADARDKLRLWIPLPATNPQQHIENLEIHSRVSYQILRDSKFQNPYAYLEFTPDQLAAPQTLRIQFRAVRSEHRVTLRPTRSSTLDAKLMERLAPFLGPDRLVPLDGLIGELSQQVTAGIDDPLAKARAVYDYVVRTMRYDKSGQGWGRGDAVFACTVRRGNCTDFHSLFIGMMRAAGIPARFEIGFSLPPDQTAGEIPGYHCWAQFYLPGVGWIPVDASEAWKHPQLREYYFGAHDPHRVLFSIGRDLPLEPAPQSGPLNFFIYPHAELGGETFSGIKTRFAFEDLPVPPAAQRSGS
jgi:transglutaminase-like putative cysteine protease